MPATDPATPLILLVDDEGCIRESVSRVLVRAGYAVIALFEQIQQGAPGRPTAALIPHQEARRAAS